MNPVLSRCIAAVCLLAISPVSVLAEVTPETPDEEAIYYLGVRMGRSLDQLALSEKEAELLSQGVIDVVTGDVPELDEAALDARLNELGQARAQVAAAEENEASADYLKKMGAMPNATTTVSGLIYEEIRPGTGESPTASSTVKVHYHGTLRSGQVFDSSVDRGQPAEFALNRVIPCWTEGVSLMKEGGKSRLTCPPALAYGDQGVGEIPGGAALTFEVELLEVL